MFLKKMTWPQKDPLVTIIMTPMKKKRKKIVSQSKDICNFVFRNSDNHQQNIVRQPQFSKKNSLL